MNIESKLGYARQHLASIAGHDDAPEGEVRGALEGLGREIAASLETLVADRHERTEARRRWRADKERAVAAKLAGRGERQTITSDDVRQVTAAELAG